jgi:Trk K+ transport system NAD-binding subunit
MPQPTLRERLRYRSDQFFQSGFTLQLFISSLIVIAVIFVFYLVVEIFQVTPGPDYGADPSGDGPYWPSVRLWWVITHILETYWLETGTFPQILSTMLTLFNFLVFAAIVGLVGSRIQQRLEQVRRGTSRVVEEGHIVILGWSGKVIPIIRELQAGLENGRQVYVLHTELPIDDIETRMRRAFRRSRQTRWVIRQGAMTDIKDLELLSIERARAVIVLQRDVGQERGDAQVVKTVMAAAHIIGECGSTGREAPQIVAEILHPSMVRLAHAAAREVPISIVEPLELLSKIILQTARQHGLVDVYQEILSHEGNEIHVVPASGLEGRSWEELLFSFRRAIPLGVHRGGEALLLPGARDADFRVRAGDSVIALARDGEGLRSASVDVPGLPAPAERQTAAAPKAVSQLLLLGWNEKVYPLLKEYAAYARTIGAQFSVTLVSPGIPVALTAMDVAGAVDCGRELHITLSRVDYLRAEVYADLQPGRFDAVIVLGDSWKVAQIEDADTRVIMTLLLLRSMRGSAENEVATADAETSPVRQQIVGEILTISNKELAESTGSVRDVIISNDLVSRIIAQVCRDARLESVLRDLMDEEGCEVYFKPALLYARKDEVVTFDQLLKAAVGHGEVVLGCSEEDAGSGNRSIDLNPGRQQRLRVHERLFLIVLAESE